MTVVELRPLSLGELLDRIFTLYRQHLWVFVGIMAVPALATFSFALFSPESQNPLAGITGGPSAAPPSLQAVLDDVLFILFISVASTLLYALAWGATAVAVADVLLGRAASVRGSYQRLQGKVLRLCALMLVLLILMWVVIVLGILVVVLPAAGLAATLSGPARVAGALVILLAVLVGLVLGAGLAFWLYAGFGVAVPALVLEDLKVGAALRRSWPLTRGHRGRVFLVFLLAMVIAYAAAFIFQGPFWVAMALAGRESPALPTLGYLAGFCGSIGHALAGPLGMIGLVLVYFDLRVRKEGLDLKLMMDSLQPGAAAPAESTGSSSAAS
ncbi:MAG: DUF7544 domain-containing protein [Candidatus Acidiferrales bacterium]